MSKTTVDLGKHGTATLRDPEDVPEKLRRRVQRANLASQIFVEELRTRGDIPADIDLSDVDEQTTRTIGRIVMTEHPEYMEQQQDAVILALVEDWPFEYPKTAEGLAEIPGTAYDKLLAACKALEPLLSPNLTAPTPPEAGNTPFDS
ncbi:hypothetical protein [Kutzneria buriramensis]|uniref:Uncharacterized protein n=1 Tax=Kutzneria buriramensis TaxID=1045776 RepID=A0A3E0HEL9_9PSEU|nr:hypothetical protein [Kutzneria buriramensis]REH43647.1 hypothetical protein BCF44_109190 [Kutzneria buriramensis]